MSNLSSDLDKTITSAVQSRVEAEVLASLADSDLLGKFVTAALSEKVKVGGYSGESKPLITHLVQSAVTDQAKSVISDEITGLAPLIRQEVREALKKSVGVIADSLVDGFVASAQGRHPSIRVSFADE